MPNLSIKNVPQTVVEKLRRRAARNHRSLQGELMDLVCRVADEAPARGGVAGAVQPPREGTRTIEQIAAEHRARWQEPFALEPLAVDMIRADRDDR